MILRRSILLAGLVALFASGCDAGPTDVDAAASLLGSTYTLVSLGGSPTPTMVQSPTGMKTWIHPESYFRFETDGYYANLHYAFSESGDPIWTGEGGPYKYEVKGEMLYLIPAPSDTLDYRIEGDRLLGHGLMMGSGPMEIVYRRK